MPVKRRANILSWHMNYVPIEESQKVDNKSSDIESLRTSLNTVYINIIKNAESAQIKFPLKAKARENECSRDNLLSYIALREHDLSNLQLKLAEEGHQRLLHDWWLARMLRKKTAYRIVTSIKRSLLSKSFVMLSLFLYLCAAALFPQAIFRGKLNQL
jgi:hypothetical protein